jgi:glycosyltransferase involved in cell wall biosynthesis
MLRDPPVLVRTRHVSVPVPNDPGTRWLYRKATARVVTTGEALRLQLVRDNGLDPARVESIPTGIDASAYAALPQDEARRLVGLPLDVPIVGIVATLRSWKGHRHLVDALAKVSNPHTMLAIVGDGPQREALERHVDAQGSGRSRALRRPAARRRAVAWCARRVRVAVDGERRRAAGVAAGDVRRRSCA